MNNRFEKEAWARASFVCGVDEVGRGSLAGPLVVAATVLPRNTTYCMLKDSKVLTSGQRDVASQWINKHCFSSIALVDPETIDRCNIYQATLLAMRKVVLQLLYSLPSRFCPVTHVLIDALPLRLESLFFRGIHECSAPKGETWSISIAAASIVAKVTRDEMMRRLHLLCPAYSLCQNKGYATKEHREKLCYTGPSVLHRTTFISHIISGGVGVVMQQRTLLE